jgi:ABC-2 type transport system ATP-binding protein
MVNMDKILVVDGVSREYPGRLAVSEVSFEVKAGTIHGFLGPNGAGKSTTMKMIAGLLPVSEGTITLMGETVSPLNLSLKNKIGLLPENAPLYLEMSVERYLEFVARLHGVKYYQDSVDRIISKLSLQEVRKRLIGNLSKGFKQRVGLAQALVYDAPFLILDEPTNGLDPQSVVELRALIQGLAGDKTILFSSHILSEVEQLCQEITIIHQGKVRASGNIHDIHKKFHQGLVLKIGISEKQSLPDLSKFGKYAVSQEHLVGEERQYHLVFEDDLDLRPEIARFLVAQGIQLHTLFVESPELEDIFLHVTEDKK